MVTSKKVSAIIILAPDHNPREGVLEVAEEQCDELIIVRGRCRGIQRNIGVESATNPYVLMVDWDCYITPGYVNRLLSKMDENVGAVFGLHVPHPSLSLFSKLEEYSKTGVVLNMGYTGAHGTLYNSNAVIESGGFNKDPNILADKAEKLIFNMKDKEYKMFFENSAINYHLHNSSPRTLLRDALTCGTTANIKLFKALGKVLYSPISGGIITVKILNVTYERKLLLLPVYFVFKQFVFFLGTILRRMRR